ncbi:hypothetical protein CEN46_23830 [Fischerella thermalis CCMEE 5318]|uniref:Uncharacterized protein n=1 Tax=Fischerella thermalis CCMEE 5318 TaxID=2019666 RepID=A0A2N6L5Z6_9CYAN|nr:hypothetical protein CEN46_23830 [Fischerella thermalis CCMEE 5318]
MEIGEQGMGKGDREDKEDKGECGECGECGRGTTCWRKRFCEKEASRRELQSFSRRILISNPKSKI